MSIDIMKIIESKLNSLPKQSPKRNPLEHQRPPGFPPVGVYAPYKPMETYKAAVHIHALVKNSLFKKTWPIEIVWQRAYSFVINQIIHYADKCWRICSASEAEDVVKIIYEKANILFPPKFENTHNDSKGMSNSSTNNVQLKHLELTSASGSELNLEALYQIMPSVFTEVRDDKTGEITHKINFNTLRELLGDNAYEGADEEYGFKWVGKNAARREAARPINKTLRPCPEESVDWENTQNLYIEGDNLEVLKLLQKSYLGKVKMIYIDPPYNTGNDFVYRDDFAMKADGYDLEAGNVDELGNRFRKSTDSDGRFHSDWCSMIYERLLIAKTLLTDEGVIFISIDDNEARNLRNICDEVFSEKNFVAQMIWEQGRKSMAAQVAVNHEYCLIYCKNKSRFIEFDKLHDNTNWREKKLGLETIYAEYDRLMSLYGSDYPKIEKGIREFYKQLPEDNPAKRQSQYKCVDRKGLYFPGDIAQGTGSGGRFDIIHPVTNLPCNYPKVAGVLE